MTFPWETTPEPEAKPDNDIIAAIQRDLAYMVTHTAVRVRSNHPDLGITVNMPRGEITPRGEVKYAVEWHSGYKLRYAAELQDIGMPQPGCVEMNSISELLAHVHATALTIGLELEP